MLKLKNPFKGLLGAQRKIEADLEGYLSNLGAIALTTRDAIGAYLKQDKDEFGRLVPRLTTWSIIWISYGERSRRTFTERGCCQIHGGISWGS